MCMYVELRFKTGNVMYILYEELRTQSGKSLRNNLRGSLRIYPRRLLCIHAIEGLLPNTYLYIIV